MNTYSKYIPNVFLAKTREKYEKGETILVETKYGKENECIVFNLIYERDGFFFYSIIRSDGFNTQEWAKKKAEKLQNAALNAEKKADSYYNTSHKITENIPLGQPILVGHHSEKRHRGDIEKSWNAMGKSVELSEKAKDYESRSEYWSKKESEINLSMPESVEYFEYKLQQAKEKHEELKSGKVERSHSFSLTYAKKEANELEKKLEFAKKLWA
jgi:hypothetical protein